MVVGMRPKEGMTAQKMLDLINDRRRYYEDKLEQLYEIGNDQRIQHFRSCKMALDTLLIELAEGGSR